MKYKKKTLTKNDKHLSDVSSGWYSKEDMAKILKWSANLFRHVNMFMHSRVKVFLPHQVLPQHFWCAEEKISGAVKCCEADKDNLVRLVDIHSCETNHATSQRQGCTIIFGLNVQNDCNVILNPLISL